jgi:hypothetical protein
MTTVASPRHRGRRRRLLQEEGLEGVRDVDERRKRRGRLSKWIRRLVALFILQLITVRSGLRRSIGHSDGIR